MENLFNKWTFCLILGVLLVVAAGDKSAATESEKKPASVIHAIPRSPGSETKDTPKEMVTGEKPEDKAATKPAKAEAAPDSPAPPLSEKRPKPITVSDVEQIQQMQAPDPSDRETVSDNLFETGSDEQANEGNAYAAKSNLDPFMPLIREQKAPETQTPDKPQRILTPLEKMALSQIKLVAVVVTDSMKIAMVEEATGKGYEVRMGTYMGKNGGQVVDISFDSIVVREIVTDFKGGRTERFQEIKLHKPDNGE
jgi:Tfp pilus assembly protein PilP